MKIKQKRVIESWIQDAIVKLQKKLHIVPSPQLRVQIDDGETGVAFKSNSFVRNFYNLMAFQSGADYNSIGDGTFGDGKPALKSITGTVQTAANITTTTHIKGRLVKTSDTGAACLTVPTTFGIYVGTDDTAESIDDFKLGVRVNAGTGAGQLTHGTMAAIGQTWDSVNRKMYSNYSRVFTNNSGADITIKEIGFSWQNFYNYAYPVYTNLETLIARDVLPSPITIANGQSKTVTYTISFPF